MFFYLHHILVLGRPLLNRCSKAIISVEITTDCKHLKMPVSRPISGGTSCWDRVKFGFAMGMAVGVASGTLFGGFSALRYVLPHRFLISSQIITMLVLQSWITRIRTCENGEQNLGPSWRYVWNIYGDRERNSMLIRLLQLYNVESLN